MEAPNWATRLGIRLIIFVTGDPTYFQASPAARDQTRKVLRSSWSARELLIVRKNIAQEISRGDYQNLSALRAFETDRLLAIIEQASIFCKSKVQNISCYRGTPLEDIYEALSQLYRFPPRPLKTVVQQEIIDAFVEYKETAEWYLEKQAPKTWEKIEDAIVTKAQMPYLGRELTTFFWVLITNKEHQDITRILQALGQNMERLLNFVQNYSQTTDPLNSALVLINELQNQS